MKLKDYNTHSEKIYTKSISQDSIEFEVTTLHEDSLSKIIYVTVPKKEVEKLVKLCNNNYKNFSLLARAINQNEWEFKNLLIKYVK